MIVHAAERVVLVALLSVSLFWHGALAEQTSPATGNQMARAMSAKVCDRPPALEEAIAQARQVLSDADLLQLCTAALLRAAPSARCQTFDPSHELQHMQRSIQSSADAIVAAGPHRRGGTDLLPSAILVSLKSEASQIDDLLGVVDHGGLGVIERCTGSSSVACLSLKANCLGDYKCYGDGTCACYTCNSGSCGIN